MKRAPILFASVALAAAACGGSADAAAGVASLDDTAQANVVESAAVPEMTQEEALLAFTACMRENGIDIDDPTVDADGNLRIGRPNAGAGAEGADPDRLRDEEFRTAREDCGELLQGVALGFQQTDRTEFDDQLLEFAACMRDNGVDMPDPDFTEFGPGLGAPGEGEGRGGPFGDIDRSDPDFQAAQEACQDILAGFGSGGGGPGPIGRPAPGADGS